MKVYMLMNKIYRAISISKLNKLLYLDFWSINVVVYHGTKREFFFRLASNLYAFSYYPFILNYSAML